MLSVLHAKLQPSAPPEQALMTLREQQLTWLHLRRMVRGLLLDGPRRVCVPA